MPPSDEKDPKGSKAFAEIEAGLGGLLGALEEALTRAVDQAGQAETTWNKSWDSANGPVRAEGGVRIRTAGGGSGTRRPQRAGPKPVNRPGSGASKNAAPRARTAATPQPAAPVHSPVEMETDVHADHAGWTLTAETPGARVDDISLRQEGTQLLIDVAGPLPRQARVALPTDFDANGIAIHLNNGILELSAPRGTSAPPPDTEGT